MANTNELYAHFASTTTKSTPFMTLSAGTDVAKLVFAGTAVASKYHAMELLSEIPIIGLSSTGQQDVLRYGFLTLDEGQQLHLYSLPEQMPESVKEEVVENALGMVLLLDNARVDPLADLQRYLTEFEELISDTALVIGVVNAERGQTMLRQYHEMLHQYGYITPVFEVNASHGYDIRLMINALITVLDI
ncbi:hypothetical protein [Thioflexithrix psekupsensis]|uniref:Uncharacterized protein n=1 Tax=Thioflexithrix psekupsensis TaxID=1570016 RepID=A0A251XBL4_9GAMM|nr:hypothetical protein [Thioflexithrix psekupsensis]OUD15480.1 hypothetical protein TPSD3_02840 [Thioflexithrix psekupsensis]